MLLFLQREMMFNLKNVTIMEVKKKYFMDIFECRINQINEQMHPEQQVRLTVKVKRNEQQD